jgi:Ca2+-transporting ATPase
MVAPDPVAPSSPLVSRRGLSAGAAAAALQAAGPNEIPHQAGPTRLRILAGQFASPLIWLLLAACLVSAALGELADAIAVGAIVVVNALVGFLQESRAEKALSALRSLTAPRARVIRDGHTTMLPAAEVVPGDLLVLEAGDVVAADAHLLEAHALSVNEAALTGESLPSEKATRPVGPEVPLAERQDSVFMGTAVATGTGVAEVTATGMHTQLGKIAHLLATAEDTATPLQQQLVRLSRLLLALCLGIVALTALLGLLRGQHGLDVFMSAVSLAVAAVPEGLPAVITIALAIGVQRMAARHVLIRKLPAVETLGSATVICTDKTGTLTTGVMAVRELWGPDHRRLLAAACACCDAELGRDGATASGDPTELAILAAGAERGIERAAIEASNPRVEVNPFDPERKRMSILRADGVLYVKGAFDLLLPLCRQGTEGAIAANADLAGRGLRVLAVAVGSGPQEADLALLGLVGLADPPRTDAIEAIADAHRAGIRTIMITGDHPLTAEAIAREMGIIGPAGDQESLVHARATPEDKLRIVRRWKERDAVVAMTGDGVNDAPALREAHIGIAMGKTGTEVTREASDMVLADDNFASIVAAVREGRGIFDNIRKTLLYLLTGNAAELLLMFSTAIAGLPLPLLPLHLLWINLVTDGLPALALVMDPTAPDVLDRPPRPARAPMLGLTEWRQILLVAAFEAGLTAVVFAWSLRAHGLDTARDFAFCTLVFCELFRAFAYRDRRLVLWQVGAFTNLRLIAVVALSVLVQIGIHHLPALAELFRLQQQPPTVYAALLLIGLLPVSALELSKLARIRRRGPDRRPVPS